MTKNVGVTLTKVENEELKATVEKLKEELKLYKESDYQKSRKIQDLRQHLIDIKAESIRSIEWARSEQLHASKWKAAYIAYNEALTYDIVHNFTVTEDHKTAARATLSHIL